MAEQKRPTVLIVDEVPSIIRILELELGIQGYNTAGCEVGDGTFRAIKEVRPNVIILELILPGLNGLEVLRGVKERFDVPVLILTTVDTEADRAEAFDLGADDYMVKPFDPLELGRRVGALLEGPPPERRFIYTGDLILDLTRQVARKGASVLSLTTNEWAILMALAAREGGVISIEELSTLVSGPQSGLHPSLIWPTVQRLREILEEDASQPRMILGGPNEGVRLGVPVTVQRQ